MLFPTRHSLRRTAKTFSCKPTAWVDEDKDASLAGSSTGPGWMGGVVLF